MCSLNTEFHISAFFFTLMTLFVAFSGLKEPQRFGQRGTLCSHFAMPIINHISLQNDNAVVCMQLINFLESVA